MFIKKIISKSTALFKLDSLIEKSGVKLIFPFYHTISDDYIAHLKHLYPILSTKRFREDLDFLLKNYSPMSSAELLNSNPVDLNRNRRFFLSFDDGLSEIYHTIAPILMEKGIPATFFLNTDFIDNKDLFYRLKTSILIEKIIEEGISDSQKRAISHLLKIIGINYNLPKDLLKIDYQTKEVLEEIAAVVNVDFKEYSKEKSPYLTTTEIKSLINQGFNIGAHSCSHPFYFLISEEDQVSETLNSISFLKEKFNVAVNMFAFPYTDFEVKKSFFEKISSEVALSFGTASLKLDTVSTNFQRIPMERKNSAEEILKEEYLLFILKKLVNKHQIIRH